MYSFSVRACTYVAARWSWYGNACGVMYCMILCRTWTQGQSLIGSNDGHCTAGPVDVPSNTGPPRPDWLRLSVSVAPLLPLALKGLQGCVVVQDGRGQLETLMEPVPSL